MVGIFTSIGPIIEEVQEFKYIHNINTAKAGHVLLIFWLFMAFTLTISYKEVLLANLVNVGYEDTMDNFDDVLRSGKPLCVGMTFNDLLFNDPRNNVKELVDNDKLVYFNFTGVVPAWIRNG